MQSLYNSLEQFIYPQFCNTCAAPLSEEGQLYCSKCKLTGIKPAEMGNWVIRLQAYHNLDYVSSFYWFGEVFNPKYII